MATDRRFHSPLAVLVAALLIAAGMGAAPSPAFAQVDAPAAAPGPAATAPTAASPAAAAAPERMRCRILPVTGSLVRTVRACHTLAQWRAIDDQGNRTARLMVEQGAQPTN